MSVFLTLLAALPTARVTLLTALLAFLVAPDLPPLRAPPWLLPLDLAFELRVPAPVVLCLLLEVLPVTFLVFLLGLLVLVLVFLDLVRRLLLLPIRFHPF